MADAGFLSPEGNPQADTSEVVCRLRIGDSDRKYRRRSRSERPLGVRFAVFGCASCTMLGLFDRLEVLVQWAAAWVLELGCCRESAVPGPFVTCVCCVRGSSSSKLGPCPFLAHFCERLGSMRGYRSSTHQRIRQQTSI